MKMSSFWLRILCRDFELGINDKTCMKIIELTSSCFGLDQNGLQAHMWHGPQGDDGPEGGDVLQGECWPWFLPPWHLAHGIHHLLLLWCYCLATVPEAMGLRGLNSKLRNTPSSLDLSCFRRFMTAAKLSWGCLLLSSAGWRRTFRSLATRREHLHFKDGIFISHMSRHAQEFDVWTFERVWVHLNERKHRHEKRK